MIRPEFPPPPLLDQGWYADPTGRYEARFWDGQKWTGHISHYGATGKDPIVRARFDHLWVRFLGRMILWLTVLVVIFFLIKAFWPDNTTSDSLSTGSGLDFSTIQVGEQPVTLASNKFSSGLEFRL
ncbi:MAG: DUF2510 domain-containing protein [Acidimicrobiales bacterium]|nr:DUF2510 domain-containing protein [Acidimicrobiales bacterium]MDP6298091.1 DUF2510 domain-containing protein [Acidimicrobiales bacterium]HJM29387.1 DUF2510 domain-containing protein [Acidimicrobiales bacterium]HJM96821.1 DUF2510 domain-containing protein [Acidimicrobiales bacterium]